MKRLITDYEQAKADAENILNQLDVISKKKNEMLTNEINQHFTRLDSSFSIIRRTVNIRKFAFRSLMERNTEYLQIPDVRLSQSLISYMDCSGSFGRVCSGMA